MAIPKKTLLRAQTQLSNATDTAGSDGHLILADGTVKMNSEYAISDRKAIAHAGHVSSRLSSLLGISDTLAAALSWDASVAPLLSSATDFKTALTTLANQIDDQGVDGISNQDEIDETQNGAGLATSGAYVVNALRNYIGSASSLDNADHLLDAGLQQEVDDRVQAFSDHAVEMAATGSTLGSSLVGYSGQVGPNGDFSISAKKVDAALDDCVIQIDATMQRIDIINSPVAGDGAAKVGYKGKAGAAGQFSIAAGSNAQVALDAIVDAVDAEEQALIDYKALLLATAAGKGLSQIGFDGYTSGVAASQISSMWANKPAMNAENALDLTLADIAQLDGNEALFGSIDFKTKKVIDLLAEDASSATTYSGRTQKVGAYMVGFDGMVGGVSGDYSFSTTSTIHAAAGELMDAVNTTDNAFDQHVIDIAFSGSAVKGAAKMGFLGHTGTAPASTTDSRDHFVVAQGTVKSALEAIINKIDLLGADEEVAGSVEYKIDLALSTAINGTPEMVDTIAALSSSFASLDEGSATGLETSLKQMIFNAKADLREGVDASLNTFNEVAARIEASHNSELLTSASTLIEAINENHAEIDATQDGAGLGTAGQYVQAAGRHYVALASSLDDADAKLDSALKASMDALGVSKAGAATWSGKTYVSDSQLQGAVGQLDVALKAAMDNMGLSTSGQLAFVAANERYLDGITEVESAFSKLDQELDRVEAAVIDLKAGDSAFVRKGDHVVEEKTATAAQLTFTIAAPAHQESVMVFVNGMLQRMGAAYDWEFGATDDKIVLKQASEAGDFIVVKYVKKTSA